jgi:transposase-like protein
MYSKGMSTSDIEEHIREMYGLEISDGAISRITDKILPVVGEWQARPLASVYAVVYLDAIHFHVRAEGQIVKKAVYIAIGLDMDGRRDVLGMYIGENESAKFWLTVLNNLKNRGVSDILIACVDGLTGFHNVIEAVYPRTELQKCVIHQIRNTTRFVSNKEIKPLLADLKRVYAAVDEQTALNELDRFEELWGKKYPKIGRSWREN